MSDLFNKAVTLGNRNAVPRKSPVYHELVTRFGTATEPMVRETASRAPSNKGVRLNEMHRDAEALASFDEVISRFDQERNAFRDAAAKASADHARDGDIMSRFDRSRSIILRETVARCRR